jgi:hypothetical protein
MFSAAVAVFTAALLLPNFVKLAVGAVKRQGWKFVDWLYLGSFIAAYFACPQ